VQFEFIVTVIVLLVPEAPGHVPDQYEKRQFEPGGTDATMVTELPGNHCLSQLGCWRIVYVA